MQSSNTTCQMLLTSMKVSLENRKCSHTTVQCRKNSQFIKQEYESKQAYHQVQEVSSMDHRSFHFSYVAFSVRRFSSRFPRLSLNLFPVPYSPTTRVLPHQSPVLQHSEPRLRHILGCSEAVAKMPPPERCDLSRSQPPLVYSSPRDCRLSLL